MPSGRQTRARTLMPHARKGGHPGPRGCGLRVVDLDPRLRGGGDREGLGRWPIAGGAVNHPAAGSAAVTARLKRQFHPGRELQAAHHLFGFFLHFHIELAARIVDRGDQQIFKHLLVLGIDH